MIFRGARGRGVRWLAAWAAAYALVFQVVLTSAAIAALPRDGNAGILCLNSARLDPSGSQTGTGDEAPLPGIHCPACLARVDLASAPPPVPTVFVVRTAVAVPFRPVLPKVYRPAARRLPLQPRAPPQMPA